MFIAMNQFHVDPERAEEFENGWRTRESHLEGFEGFLGFALLKGDDPGDYISHSMWASRDAFMSWATSDAFKKAHSERMPDGILTEHPRARFYEAVLEERPSGVPNP